jgi:hypothetical protein
MALAAIALATSVAAAVVVMQEARRTAPRFSPAPIFPGLDKALGAAQAITVKSPEGEIEIRRMDNNMWVVPAASSYPAHSEAVRKMLNGLVALRAVERRTARPDWHAMLDLGAPGEGGKATEIRVEGENGALLAGLLVGKVRPAGGLAGEDAFYVRRLGEDQTYLAQGDLPLEVERGDWLDPTIVDIARERVARVAMQPIIGPSYTISRASPETQSFVVDALPRGRRMMSETAANPIGAALSDFSLEDVRPKDAIDFTKAARAEFETFDGLVIAVETVEADDAHWVRVSATTKPPIVPHTGTKAHDVAQEMSAINARVGAWAYKVAEWKADLFAHTLDSLLAEPEKKAEQD